MGRGAKHTGLPALLYLLQSLTIYSACLSRGMAVEKRTYQYLYQVQHRRQDGAVRA